MTGFSASKTSGIIVNELLMSATVFGGHFLMVEGDDDSKFWKTRINRNSCQVVIAGDKTNVLAASRQLDRRRFTNAFGVVDLDYDWDNTVSYSSRIAATDLHDIETMMLDSAAFGKVMVEHGDAGKIQLFECNEHLTVLDALIKRALPFGRLRWYNHQQHLGICFDDLSPYRFIDRETWTLDEQALVNEFVKQDAAKNGVLNITHFSQWLSTARGAPWRIIQGHDALCILAQGLKHVLGNTQFNESDLAGQFRLAYEQSHFENSTLCSFVRRWEKNHRVTVLVASGAAERVR